MSQRARAPGPGLGPRLRATWGRPWAKVGPRPTGTGAGPQTGTGGPGTRTAERTGDRGQTPDRDRGPALDPGRGLAILYYGASVQGHPGCPGHPAGLRVAFPPFRLFGNDEPFWHNEESLYACALPTARADLLVVVGCCDDEPDRRRHLHCRRRCCCGAAIDAAAGGTARQQQPRPPLGATKLWGLPRAMQTSWPRLAGSCVTRIFVTKPGAVE